MEFTTKTIREIAVEAPLTTRVFEELKIDYCCGGHVGFVAACEKAGVDPAVVESKLEAIVADSSQQPQFVDQRTATELCDYIVSTHHVFTRNELERLAPLMAKVVRKHGDLHPELFVLQEKLTILTDELLVHMGKEEMVLFPYIKELDAASSDMRHAVVPHFGTVKNPVRMMMFEHDAAGDLLRKMRECTSEYRAPEGACPSFLALYAGVEDLEKDLHQHIHLENNLLFVKAIELENEIAELEYRDRVKAA